MLFIHIGQLWALKEAARRLDPLPPATVVDDARLRQGSGPPTMLAGWLASEHRHIHYRHLRHSEFYSPCANRQHQISV